MSSFTIMVDTGSDLPQEYIDKHNIKMIPIPFHIDGRQHDGGRWQEISEKGFYDMLRSGSAAGTALINPEAYVDVFTEYADKNEALLVITLSSGLSGTCQNSIIALDDVKGKYPGCEIYVVDSVNAAGGEGFVTTLAVDKRDEGLTAEQTAQWLDQYKQSCLALFTVDDLMYLHRGGRLSKLSAVAGSIIGIKPLLNVAPDGTLKLKDKVRGRRGALSTLFKQMKRSLNQGAVPSRVIISHTDCLEDAEALADMIREAYDVQDIIVTMMGPVIGAHVGPGCVALFFAADMTRDVYEAKFYG